MLEPSEPIKLSYFYRRVPVWRGIFADHLVVRFARSYGYLLDPEDIHNVSTRVVRLRVCHLATGEWRDRWIERVKGSHDWHWRWIRSRDEIH